VHLREESVPETVLGGVPQIVRPQTARDENVRIVGAVDAEDRKDSVQVLILDWIADVGPPKGLN
jgi:hypothetical protein